MRKNYFVVCYNLTRMKFEDISYFSTAQEAQDWLDFCAWENQVDEQSKGYVRFRRKSTNDRITMEIKPV